MKDSLESVITAALADRWESLPLLGSWAGVEGWDHTLGRIDPEAVAERVKNKKSLLLRLGKIRPRGPEEELDHKVLSGSLAVQIPEIERYRRLEWDAALCPLTVVRSLHILITRPLPSAYRRDAIRSRLAEAPRYLRQGLDNLRGPDPEALRVAAHACASGVIFLKDAIWPLDPAGARAAAAAFEDYARELRRGRGGPARKRFPIGRELFELKLRKEHGLACDARELVEVGRAAQESTLTSLRALARRLDPNSNWRALLAQAKSRRPSGRTLLSVYRAETLRSRRFCLDKNLATFPNGERLLVEATPRFEWDTSPFAALLPPGPFERSRTSRFWVTPVDPAWPAKKRRERLEGHSLDGLASVCPHEGYPGHHLQLVRSNMIASRVRKVFTTPVLIEGWAFYCEQMMEEEGYIRDARSRLYRLKDQLWRAVRVEVDAGLHVGGWSPRRAADAMVRGAMLEPANAEAEVSRYCTSPTQPMSYLIGKIEILKLRERCRRAWGPGFTLKKFHDWLLDFGSMPPSWIQAPAGKMLE